MTGIAPRSLDAALAAQPATVQESWFARLFWAGNLSETGHFLWVRVGLASGIVVRDNQDRLATALFAVSRHYSVELHLQKGLAGALADVVAAAKDTPINPAVLDAFALAIIAGEGPPAYPGVIGHEPNLASARRKCRSDPLRHE